MLILESGRMTGLVLTSRLRSLVFSHVFYGNVRHHSSCTQDQPVGSLNRLRAQRPEKPDQFALPLTPARTRFAPSPTGYLHLGSLRTALFNYLIARATGGQFIIRVEDTDRTRIVPDAEERLFNDLKWAQLDWDEAPDIGGPYGPYRQSDRLEHYQKYADELLQGGKAYRCFCSSDDLEKHKINAVVNRLSVNYPGTCRSISPEESEQRAVNGEVYVVRFKSDGIISTMDKVYGPFTKKEPEDDFILIKSDKYPTYHFANVIDDYMMKITHVIRGAEWLISTPKHVALYNAFEWTPPEFAHVGLLTDRKGQKLSKRNHDIDISSYRKQAVLPLALNNWVVLLGWSMSGEQSEIVKNLDELVKKFTFKFTKGSIKVNLDKLRTFELRHLQNMLADENLDVDKLNENFIDPIYKAIIKVHETEKNDSRGPLLKVMQSLETARPYLVRIFRDNKNKYLKNIDLLLKNPALVWEIPPRAYVDYLTLHHRNSRMIDSELKILQDLQEVLAGIKEEDWDVVNIGRILAEHVKKLQTVAPPETGMMVLVHACVRFALVGGHTIPSKPSSFMLDLLGKEESLKRFDNAFAAYSKLL